MNYFKQGNVLDVLARKALWDVGLDYMHGTGHGVGHYLNVHEGPMGIHMRPNPDDPVSVLLHQLYLLVKVAKINCLNFNFSLLGIDWKHDFVEWYYPLYFKILLEHFLSFLLSLEPGYYQDGEFGIRIENLVKIVTAHPENTIKDRKFLTFENLTFVPIQSKMIIAEMLTKEEVCLAVVS